MVEIELDGRGRHGSEVISCDWHPTKALIATGSKDNLIKLWSPKKKEPLFSIHEHKNDLIKVS